MNDDSPAPTNPPRNLMLLIALTQGFALLLRWRALTNETWPATQPAVNIPLWTVAVTYPALLLLSLESGRIRRTVIRVSLFAAVLILPAFYIGWQASPYGEFPIESIIFVYVVTLGVACFKGLMYLQHYVAQAPIAYGTLFRYSWRNALVVGLTAPLVWGVALILFLWGALFEAIEIDFFADLFARDWFLFPVLAVVFGLGVLIFRRLAMVIDGITSLLEGLIRLLFPLVISVVAIFLVTLPFTGLQPLWETGNGTALLMGINIIALFFANAVYQPGRRPPYPLIVHRLLYGGACLLPIVSVLAFYGLYLRIAQYGWTVERCWALALCCLMALFSAGYAVGIVRRRDDWPETLGRVNKAMGWVIVALTLLVNTPLLDFRSISLASQFARVDRGEIEIYDFDFFYARQYLARPAWLRTRALLDEIGESDERLAELIRDPRPQRVPITNAEELWERVVYRPEPFEVPEDLRPLIESSYAAPYDNLVLVAVDLNQDRALEYVLIGSTGFGVLWAEGFYRQEEEWLSLNVRRTAAEPSGNDLEQSLQSGEIEAVPPEFQDLLIGDVELSFMPR